MISDDWGVLTRRDIASLQKHGISSIDELIELIKKFGLFVGKNRKPLAIIGEDERIIFALGSETKGWADIIMELDRRGFDWKQHIYGYGEHPHRQMRQRAEISKRIDELIELLKEYRERYNSS